MSSDSQNLELGNYRVLKRDNGSLWELGKGSYGTTYKAEHVGLERVSALKVINEHLIRDDVAKQRFQQEAKAAASLDHPHIASIHDFGEVDGMFYYAMKYCSGGDLENFCNRRGPQAWPVVKNFALQILGALKAAHDKGMLHRDLKPSNVMLADENEPINLQLIDFGLVKALDHLNPSETNITATREGAFMGNPLTASPEQFREEELDERSDLFSVGITLWYLLHGGSPFGNVAAAKIAHQRLSIASYDDMLPANLPDDARAILNKLLATDRDQRFRYAQEVIDALQASSDESATVEEISPIFDNTPLAEAWEITSPIKQLPYGTYYGTYHKLDPSIPPCTAFIPDDLSPSLVTIKQRAGQLLQTNSNGLCNFFREGEIDGTHLYLCQGLSNCTLHFLLQLVNRLSIHNDLALLKQVALAVDEAAANQLSGVEMEDNEIFLALDPNLGRAPLTAEEWPAYIQNEARADGGYTAGIVAIVLPRLVDDASTQEASATIGGDDLASNPLARFAGFLYRVLSGMSAKQTAYLSTVNYVSFSDVSEESNQYLSHIIAGMDTPDSALSMLQQVCSNEGSHFDGAAATIQRSVAATNPMATVTAPPKSVVAPPVQPSPPQAASASRTTPIPPPKTAPASTAVSPPPLTPPSATAVVPPPKATPTPPPKQQPKSKSRKKVKKKKGIPLLMPLLTLILLGAIGAGGYFGWQHFNKEKKKPEEEFVYEGPVEDGIGEVTFSNISLSEDISESYLGLQDTNGMALGRLTKNEGKIVLLDFPVTVFNEPNRWPLKFASLKPDEFIVQSRALKADQFSEISSETKLCDDAVSIDIRQTTMLTPVFSINGNPIEDSHALLKFLSSKEANSQWQIIPNDGQTRLILGEGQSFPVEAKLAIPSTDPIELSIERSGEISASIAMKTRPIKIIGIESTHHFTFTPDLTKIYDSAARKLFEKHGKVSAGGNDILNGDPTWQSSEWQLPTTSGSLLIKFEGRESLVPVSRSTSRLIFVGASNHVPDETEDLASTRDLAETGSDPKLQSQFAAQLYDRVASNQLRDETLAGTYERFAFLWNLSAAYQNYPRAMADIGDAYRKGKGTRVDKDKAFQWIKKSAEAGNPRGLLFLGECYLKEIGCKQNIQESLKNFQAASEKGELDATAFLAEHYLNLYENNKSDKEALEKAVKLIKESPFEEHFHLSYLSGYIHLMGIGVEKNEEIAKKHLLIAKELGNKYTDALLKQIK